MNKDKQSEKQIEERWKLARLLDDIEKDWENYLDDCYENETSPCIDYETFCTDAILDAGYRKQSENVIELPCKVGEKIYQTDGVKIYESTINEITLTSNKTIFVTENIAFDETAIGKSIFLTKEEAEAKMKGGAE